MLKKEDLKENDIVVVFNRGVEDLQTKEHRITSIRDGKIILDNGLEFIQDTLLDGNVGTRMLFLGGKSEYILYVKRQRELIEQLDGKIAEEINEMKICCKKLSSCCTRIKALNRTGNILRTLKNTEIKRLVKSVDKLNGCKDDVLSLLLQVDARIQDISAAVNEYLNINNLIEAGKPAVWTGNYKNIQHIKETWSEISRMQECFMTDRQYKEKWDEIKKVLGLENDFKQQETAEIQPQGAERGAVRQMQV